MTLELESQHPHRFSLSAARLRLISGEALTATRIAAAAVWAESTPLRDRAELFIIKAGAYLRLARHEEAMNAFRQGHALAESAEDLTPYLVLSAEERRQLAELSGIAPDAEHFAAVAATPSPWPEKAELVTLSPRESAVLSAMRQHDSVAAMARSLTVSVNTVKKQIVSLYAKLGVHDRTSALLCAERLGLLDPHD